MGSSNPAWERSETSLSGLSFPLSAPCQGSSWHQLTSSSVYEGISAKTAPFKAGSFGHPITSQPTHLGESAGQHEISWLQKAHTPGMKHLGVIIQVPQYPLLHSVKGYAGFR